MMGASSHRRFATPIETEKNFCVQTKPGSYTTVSEKTKGGRWTNYDRRVSRSVAFLGIERVVPEYESRVLRSYSRYFAQSAQHGWENNIARAVGDVLGKDYASFEYLRHRAHRLPVVECEGCRYSGFNMGAGESALFELFAAIFACPDPLLLVVDELELGLHEEAQVRLVEALKKLCKTRKLQVICTTHSGALLGALPPEGRLFLERQEMGHVTVLSGITPAYATSKLAGTNHPELDVLVEDDVGDAVLRGALSNSMRSRIRVIPVGSHSAVARHVAMRATEGGDRAVCAILDGDQRTKKRDLVRTFIEAFEVRDSTLDQRRRAWLEPRIEFLPGNEWPEKWIVSALTCTSANALDQEYGLTAGERARLLRQAFAAGKHNEFHELGQRLQMPAETVRSRLVSCALADAEEERTRLAQFVDSQLNSACEWPT